ncbi:MAG: hypothetical protein K1W34_13795 [Lachnospiraceae bacterium]
MKGIHRVVVYTKRLRYEFELRRNITVIRGDSATGKTTLVDMVQEYANNPSGSPVELVCDKKCYVLSGTLKQSYHEFYRIYGIDLLREEVKPERIVAEDSNSGYQFFCGVCSDYNLECDTAGGKSNLFHVLNSGEDEKILAIADGAAFGSEIDKVIQLMKRRKNLVLYLPESFEWLILLSDVLNDREIMHILDNPYEYIESREYFSWERFFTKLLTEKSEDTYLAYSKKSLNKAYLNDRVKLAILSQMKKIVFGN